MLNLATVSLARLLIIFAFSRFLPVAIAHERAYQEFGILNATIGGRLQSAKPLALPCFSNYDGHPVTPDLQACSFAQDNYDSQPYRSLRYGNTLSVSYLSHSYSC